MFDPEALEIMHIEIIFLFFNNNCFFVFCFFLGNCLICTSTPCADIDILLKLILHNISRL